MYNNPVNYVARPLAVRLLESRSATPVLIVEGARAVGKTTTMRREIAPEGYFYVTLADPSTLAEAESDTAGWLRRLALPAIVDEAQLHHDLPLALKDFVDERGPGNHVILTGSASIGRTGLGGADPLTRRSLRLTMAPLTAWELAEQGGSIVDALFHGDPVAGFGQTIPEHQLLRDMTIGGFPAYARPAGLLTTRRLGDHIRSDITALFGDSPLEDARYDATIARAALDSLLRTPGAIFNASRLGSNLDLDRRTVDRYMSMFERQFLLHWLPNLATSPARQGHSRAKVHPVDTSFAVESLTRAGVDLPGVRESFGAVLESYVVNQIVAATSWALTPTGAYYWRKASASTPEVDLVLLDDDHLVGVEVKAASTVTARDLRGLRALDAERGLHRGFVVYTGDAVRQLDTNLWALPVSALANANAFAGDWARPRPETEEIIVTPTTAQPLGDVDAAVFLSYVRKDDEYEQGRIVQFARDVAETYAFLFGRDIRLFVDRDNTLWGEAWADRLANEVAQTSFLVSVVTPRYLTSEACAKEVLDFRAAAARSRTPGLLLPLIWVDIADTDVVSDSDPVRQAILSSQYESIVDVPHLERSSIEYKKARERIARRLRETVEARNRGVVVAASPLSPGDADRDRGGDTDDENPDGVPDVLTSMQRIEDLHEELGAASNDFKESMERIGEVFRQAPPLTNMSPAQSNTVMAGLGTKLTGPVEALDTAAERLGGLWERYETAMERVVTVVTDLPKDDETRHEIAESLDGVAAAFELPGADVIAQQLQFVGNLSRHLQPMSRSVAAALRLLRGMQQSARSWRAQV